MAGSITVGDVTVGLTLDDSSVASTVKAAEKKIAQLGEGAGKALDSIPWKKMGAVAGAALAGIVFQLSQTASHITQMGNAAKALGVTVETMSQLEYAAKATGVATEQLGQAVITLSKRMQEKGIADEGVRVLAALGVEARNADYSLRSVDKVLLDVANAFSRMPDGVNKTTIAVSLFGDAGTRLIPLLNRGSEGMREMMQEANRLGITLDGGTTQSVQNFNETWSKIKAVMEAVSKQVLEKVLPTLQYLADNFLKASRDASTMSSTVNAITITLKTLVSAGEVVKATFNAVWIVLKNTFGALAEVIKGNFSGAMDAIRKMSAELNANMEETATNFAVIWGEWATTVEYAGNVAFKSWNPVVKSAEEATVELTSFKMAAQYAAADLLAMPTETAANKMEKLNELVRTGALTWREYLAATKQVSDGQKQAMDDLVSASSSALTTLFAKSKTAAIASALINTYQGITKAIAQYPPPISYAMAGLQAALGFAQVRQIQSTSATSKSGGSSVPSASAASAATGSSGEGSGGAPVNSTLTVRGISANSLFTGSTMRSFAEQLLSFQRDGGRVILS